MLFLVATTSLPTVNRQNADCWNAARSCQNQDILGYAFLGCGIQGSGILGFVKPGLY